MDVVQTQVSEVVLAFCTRSDAWHFIHVRRLYDRRAELSFSENYSKWFSETCKYLKILYEAVLWSVLLQRDSNRTFE